MLNTHPPQENALLHQLTGHQPSISPRRIMIFNDSSVFGGHELAFFKVFNDLLNSDNISAVQFIYYKANVRLEHVLADFAHPKLTLMPGPYRSTPASALTTPFRRSYRNYVRDCYHRMSPDTVLLLQGRIEGTMVPMFALPSAADVVSYLPMAHSAHDLGKTKPLGYFMDKTKRWYYRRPQRLITPSNASADQLRRAGAIGTIHVVPNFVLQHPLPDKLIERSLLNISSSKQVALFLGRFDIWQKGLDTLLLAIKRDAHNLQNWHFLFVGEGPGEGVIRSALSKFAAGSGSIHGWTNRPRDILASSDALILPSRFEGVPLSMLEALSDGIPILATDIDVFQEYLPAPCRWDFKTAPGLSQRLETITASRFITAYRSHANAILLRKPGQLPSQLFEKALLSL